MSKTKNFKLSSNSESAEKQVITPKRVQTKDNFIFTKGEEIFNAVTHIVGGGLSVIALIIMLIFSNSAVAVTASVIYGLSMIIMYVMSAIYHFLRPNRAKKVFRIFDHCAIFLLIAGTYTPYCLLTLKETNIGIALLIIIWSLAVLGITLNAINMHDKRVMIFSQICYILMGWCVIFAISPVLKYLELAGLIWLLLGGIFYTAGVVFFAFGARVKYFHSVWHLFVLLGSILQFVSVFWYVIL